MTYNPGRFVSTNTNTTWFLLKRFRQVLILVDPVDDEEDRPQTDPSSVSDLGTGLGVILVLKRLDFSPTLCRDSWFVNFGIQFDFCVETPFSSVRFSARSIDRDSLVSSGLCIRYRIEYRIEPRISTCLLNMNLNKGRD